MNMIAYDQINAIAKRAAQAHLSRDVVLRVLSEPTVDVEGLDALLLTIVVAPDSDERLEGDALLDTLVQIQRDLQSAGENRFAIVSYATEAELADDGDTES